MLISDDKLLILTERVVKRYIVKGSIPKKDEEDFKMQMVEKFLIKKCVIEKKFLGKSTVNTYCTAVLNNMCCELIRKDFNYLKIKFVDIPDKISAKYYTSKNIIIYDEINYLNKIFSVFNYDKAKIIIALSYYYQIDIDKNMISDYLTINRCNNNFELSDNYNLNKGQTFLNLSSFFCKVENKNFKADAVRIWLNKKIIAIIKLLNSPFNRANYDKESFQILFELYIAKQSNNY